MSTYLIVTLGVLLFGAVLVAFLAWRRPHYAGLAAGVTLALSLLIWLLAGQSLPLGSEIAPGQNAGDLHLFDWRVDGAGWQLSFIVLLMLAAVVIVSLVQTRRQDLAERPAREKALLPAILLAGAAVLLTLWANNVASLLITWVVLSLTWLLLLWTMTEGRVGAGRLLPRAGALLTGALFLWLAIATSGMQGSVFSLEGSWSGPAGYLLLLAAIGPLGAVPLQWWRPLAWSLPAETAAIVHLVPVAAGGSLLARSVGQTAGQEPGVLLIGTLLGLLSILFGISLAWMYVASPSRSLSGLAMAQAGVIVLAAVWVGSAAAIAATRVLILAVCGLYLAARRSPRRLPWPAIVPLLALAGFPLTAGSDGLVSIYDAWLDSGNIALLVMGAALSMFLLAAGILAVRREMPVDALTGRNPLVKARHYLALALPSLGLLTFSGRGLGDRAVWAWVAMAIALGGSVVLNRFEAEIQDTQLSLRRALHLGFAGQKLMRFLARIGKGLDSAARETAAILEGEGGMLWLLVFLVVIWLARR